MEKRQINEIATIVSRFSEVNSASSLAIKSLKEFRFKIFSDLISDEDKIIIEKSLRIIEGVKGATNIDDAISYYNNLNKQQ